MEQRIEASLLHAIPQKPFPQYVDETEFLKVKSQLSRHPDEHVKEWSKNPRLYTLLRMLAYDVYGPVFQRFQDHHISDIWLPLAESTLQILFPADAKAVEEFDRAQNHVLSQPQWMGDEKIRQTKQVHRHVQYSDEFFDTVKQVGKGGSAEVVHVRHLLSDDEFACKRIARASVFNNQKLQLREYKTEVGVLKKIPPHHHIVELVASFTDFDFFSLLLKPVADDVLKSMLERQSREQPLSASELNVLRQSFGCLANVLAHLHENEVRHKDIKPGNILLSNGRVYLCDFGISRDWSEEGHSTTDGDVLKFTLRYGAAEVADRDRRNSSADIWSLGCVFLEIISVIKGYTLEEVNRFMHENSRGESARGLARATDAMNAWIEKIRSANDNPDDLPLEWIKPMIRIEPSTRLKVSELVDTIHSRSAELAHGHLYIGGCCAKPTSRVQSLGIDTSPLQQHEICPPRNLTPLSTRAAIPDPFVQRGILSPHTPSPRASIGPRESTDTVPSRHDSIGSPKPLLHDLPQSPTREPLRSGSILSAYSAIQPLPPNIKCHCSSQPNESHILNATLASCALGDENELLGLSLAANHTNSTVETSSMCEVLENRVQVYETRLEAPDIAKATTPSIWLVTRRLVVSFVTSTSGSRRCHSLWLPLANIRFFIEGTVVVLYWSDCNQMTKSRRANWELEFDWIYNPNSPNNAITLHFNENGDANRFVDTVRLPFEKRSIVRKQYENKLSDTSELHIFDVGHQGSTGYRTATLTDYSSHLASSNLYVLMPLLDFEMESYRLFNSPGFLKVIFKSVWIPMYQSDVLGEPAEDPLRIAKFKKALLVRHKETNLAVDFPMATNSALSDPPSDVRDMLKALTGWTLCYFGTIDAFRVKKKLRPDTKYGRATVLLWQRGMDVNEPGSRTRRAAITFRMRDGADSLWITYPVTSNTEILKEKGSDVTMTVSKVIKGDLLDIRTMTATAEINQKTPKHAHSGSKSNVHDESSSDLVLCFPDEDDRRRFVPLVVGFSKLIKHAAPLTRVDTSSDSIRRTDTFATVDYRSPPPRYSGVW